MAKEKSRGNREQKKPKKTPSVASSTSVTTEQRITAKKPAGKTAPK